MPDTETPYFQWPRHTFDEAADLGKRFCAADHRAFAVIRHLEGGGYFWSSWEEPGAPPDCHKERAQQGRVEAVFVRHNGFWRREDWLLR
jgi:hypothetical protein